MASPAVIDIEYLLAPISGENACGNDPRLDPSPLSTYQQIRSARSAARDAEKNALYSEGGNDADEHWRKIIVEAPKLLAQQAKDLDVATWLTEALARRNGFAGVRDALNLIEGLITQYWDNLYPLPDEDGIETRIGQFAGLSGQSGDGVLIAPIRRIAITEGYTPGPFAYFQYQQAVEIERISDENLKESKLDKLGFSLRVVEQVVAATSPAFFVDLLDDVAEAVATSKRIEAILEDHCGSYDAPSMRSLINVLEECASAVNHLAKHLLPVGGGDSTSQDSQDAAGEAPSGSEGLTVQMIAAKPDVMTRERAFKQLYEISNFFQSTEPHSPVAHLLKKAVKWGDMPLEELILELIPDRDARRHFTMVTGVTHIDD